MTLDEILELPRPLGEEHRRIVHEHLLESMAAIGGAYLEIKGQIRKKPLIGGVFGSGQYMLGSHNSICTGLDRVTYFVMEEKTWLVIGHGASIAEALSRAREALALIDPSRYARFVAALVGRREREELEAQKQRDEARAAWIAQRRAETPAPIKSIPKRRREIFEKSDGKCHYCGTALTLDGKWHIEHKMPKALMGGNEPSNLVASCVTCNHKKRDMTDEEFIAKRGQA